MFIKKKFFFGSQWKIIEKKEQNKRLPNIFGNFDKNSFFILLKNY